MLFAIPVAATGKGLFVYYYERARSRQLATEDGALFKGTGVRSRRSDEPCRRRRLRNALMASGADREHMRSEHVNSAEIRESFLSFFESKGCRASRRSSLIPDDPSLLLTTAGMVQFKPVFLGVKDLGFTRATTVQKCVRTTDIDIIGTTGRHHSFFEMLGNFSFGDYFKSEASAWACEYSTDGARARPRPHLVLDLRGRRRGRGDLASTRSACPPSASCAWARRTTSGRAGPTGPCGPCSELYYDQGPEVGCGSPRLRAGLRLRPLPRVLEPRLHAVRPAGGRHAACRCPSRTSTPAWASSASPRSCRA